MERAILVRHGESEFSARGLVNGEVGMACPLTARGREQAGALAAELAADPIDVCVTSGFERTRETAELALAGRDVELRVEPLLDDIDVGDLEGETIESYRAWKRRHTRSDPFPGGESLDDAARRYAAGWTNVLESPYASVLVICHEIPLRYALNGALGSDSLDGPIHELLNARPYLFDEEGLARGVAGIERVLSVADARDAPA